MARVEYLVLIGVDGKLDPDSAETVRAQADEWIDGLVYWIMDAGTGAVSADVLSTHDCDGVSVATSLPVAGPSDAT